MEIFIVKDQV